MNQDFGCSINSYDPSTGKYNTTCKSNEEELQYDCTLRMVDGTRYVTQCRDNNGVDTNSYCTLSSLGIKDGKIQYETQCSTFNLDC